MFICAGCGESTKPREKGKMVVTDYRIKKYECGSQGTEIIHEARICNACAEKVPS